MRVRVYVCLILFPCKFARRRRVSLANSASVPPIAAYERRSHRRCLRIASCPLKKKREVEGERQRKNEKNERRGRAQPRNESITAINIRGARQARQARPANYTIYDLTWGLTFGYARGNFPPREINRRVTEVAFLFAA
jgi:hypothetical protein